MIKKICFEDTGSWWALVFGEISSRYMYFFLKKKKATLHLIFSNEILKVYVREVKIEQRRRSKLEEWGVGAGGFASQENFLI